MVRCQALILEDDFPSRLFFFFKRHYLVLELQLEVEPYVEHGNLMTFPLYSPLKCEFKLKPQLKVNPYCSSWCPATNLRWFCSAVLSFTLYEAGQGSLAPHVQ